MSDLLKAIQEAGIKTGYKWIMRDSFTGRGLRLHQDPLLGRYDTPEEAIKAWIKANTK